MKLHRGEEASSFTRDSTAIPGPIPTLATAPLNPTERQGVEQAELWKECSEPARRRCFFVECSEPAPCFFVHDADATKSAPFRVLQAGGGVCISSGRLSFDSCDIHDNHAVDRQTSTTILQVRGS